MQRPLGAQISFMLKERGVDVIFGIPGVHNQELYRGIEEAGITHVLARHEQGAGFMADGYARATGRPGVAYVITGPGLCNIMTPMGQAYSDSVPMLVISSCLNRADLGLGRGRLHEMKDQEAAAEAVCDWSKTAMDAASAYQLIDRALTEFRIGRKRPKHIQVPIEVLQALADPAPEAPGISQQPPIGAASAHPRQIDDLAQMLRAASRPLLVFGGGAVHAAGPAREVLRRTGAASFTTYAGRGVVEGASPLGFGATLARPQSAEVIGRADVVLVVGSELSEVDLWRNALGCRGRMVRIDIDPAEVCDGAADMVILSDAAGVLSALAAALPDAAGSSDWDPAEVASLKQIWRAEADAERPGIVAICDALQDVLPAETMFFSDMTQFAYVAKEVWDMDRTGHWHHPYGFGTLGYALPAAIGGAVARPDLPTVAIAGDYGFQYTLQEFGTAVELGLPLPILLWDNGKLKEIEDSMIHDQIAPNAVIARNPDFLKLAEAYGAHSVQPQSLGHLQASVLMALRADRPTLIRMTPELPRAG